MKNVLTLSAWSLIKHLAVAVLWTLTMPTITVILTAIQYAKHPDQTANTAEFTAWKEQTASLLAAIFAVGLLALLLHFCVRSLPKILDKSFMNPQINILTDDFEGSVNGEDFVRALNTASVDAEILWLRESYPDFSSASKMSFWKRLKITFNLLQQASINRLSSDYNSLCAANKDAHFEIPRSLYSISDHEVADKFPFAATNRLGPYEEGITEREDGKFTPRRIAMKRDDGNLENALRRLGILYSLKNPLESPKYDQLPFPRFFKYFIYPLGAKMSKPTSLHESCRHHIIAYAMSAWQRIAIHAIGIVSMQENNGNSVATADVIRYLEKVMRGTNFIVENSELSASALYDWARSQLYGSREVFADDERTELPEEYVNEIVKSMTSQHLLPASDERGEVSADA